MERELLTRHRVDGRLDLRFDHRPTRGRTAMTVREQRQPLQVVRAFPLDDGGALVHLHNISGGVLAADRLDLRVELGPRSHVQLTTTGATRVYRAAPDAREALQRTTVHVGEDALLEYLPDQLIPYAGSRYRQETSVELAPGAGLFWWEIVAPGREAHGERFAYERLQTSFAISAGGRPIALERALLEPALRPLSSPARLGPYAYYASFYICRAGLEPARWPALEAALAERALRLSRPGQTLWAVSALVADGLVVRAVSVSGRPLSAGLLELWAAARRELYGRESAPPRKIY